MDPVSYQYYAAAVQAQEQLKFWQHQFEQMDMLRRKREAQFKHEHADLMAWIEQTEQEIGMLRKAQQRMSTQMQALWRAGAHMAPPPPPPRRTLEFHGPVCKGIEVPVSVGIPVPPPLRPIHDPSQSKKLPANASPDMIEGGAVSDLRGRRNNGDYVCTEFRAQASR